MNAITENTRCSDATTTPCAVYKRKPDRVGEQRLVLGVALVLTADERVGHAHIEWLLVPDEIWEEAARHYDEPQLAALVISIAMINAWNRINAVTRQIAGEWVEQWVTKEPAAQAA